MRQDLAILNHLQTEGTITPLVAMQRYGCMRLAARVFDLRQHGYRIKSHTIHRNGKRYSSYALEQANG